MDSRILGTMPISALKGISVLQISKLAKIGLHTIHDLLLHLPLRYEDRTHIYQIRDLTPGIYATVKGKVLNCTITFSNRKMMICQISDNSGILTILFFNFSRVMRNNFVAGRHILVYGEVKHGKYSVEMIHPEYWIRNDFNTFKSKNTLTPIYSTTEGIKQIILRKIIGQALNLLNKSNIDEILPPKLAKNLISLPNALHTLHQPPSSIKFSNLYDSQYSARQRLIFEELLAYNLSMLTIRDSIRKFRIKPLILHDDLKNKLLSLLPFKLTVAQLRVISEIEQDMALDIPMMRLVQGDVGSGKTLIAALAALHVIANGKQVALIAPTELLVEQHLSNLNNWFSPLGVKIGFLIGKQKRKLRIAQQDAIAKGQVQIVVGTHAIFQERVKFQELMLVIIDEQHRFGVDQRLALWKKEFMQHGYYPHQLIMTATPIPRTLAMTNYANLDISIIDELPPGRIPVITVVIHDNKRENIIKRIFHACIKESRQVYWVCTLIEESDILEAQAAETTWKELKLVLPKLNIGLVHGRMKPAKRQEIIHQFKRGDIHLLVATPIIEVGLDIPNASLMIIENPERLGLSQLHQLRGRIGRGKIVSHCVLLYKSPLSKIARKRLQVLRDNNDGFTIAQKDLEIRGPGEILGTRQTGNVEFRVANLMRDQEIIPRINHIARFIHKNYPECAVALINRWMPKLNNCSNR